MTQNKFTTNNNPTLVAVSNADGETPVYLYADPSTHGLVVSATISATGLATDTNQTSGNQKTQIVDGSGNVIASSGNALNVNTVSLIPGTGATNLGKAEDSPHSNGDVGVMMLAVRNDAGAVLAGSDGDYVPVTTDATGALRGDMNGTLSSVNSSTATLTSGSVFTGTSEDVLIYNEIRVSVFADQASATDGLSIQQSSNGTNWDIADTYTIPASTGKTFAVPRQGRFFRVVYTNGGTGQAAFRLQTIFNRVATMASSQRASDGYTNETDLEEVWAFNSHYNGTTWDRFRGDTTGTNVHVLPATSGGWATFNATSGDGSTALTATAQQVKGTAGQVGGWYIYNPNATATYVNFYNVVSASVTVGTTNQQMVICIPATSGANVEFTNGISFSTAVSISATTTGGGNTAPATALEANIYFK